MQAVQNNLNLYSSQGSESLASESLATQELRVLDPSEAPERYVKVESDSAFESLLKTNGYLVFKPFVNYVSGKTYIKFKDSEQILEINYNPNTIPNPKQLQRSAIKLHEIPRLVLNEARLAATEILFLWKEAQTIKKDYQQARSEYKKQLAEAKIISPNNPDDIRYAATPAKNAAREKLEKVKTKGAEHPFGRLFSSHTTVTFEKFNQVFDQIQTKLIEGNKLSRENAKSDDFRALVAYLCVRQNSKLGFSVLPFGMLVEDGKNAALISKRIQTIGRYFVQYELRVTNAEMIEKETLWTAKLGKAGLGQIYKIVSIPDFLKICFPGYLDGANPPIRDWFFSWPNKWKEGADNLIEVRNTCEKALKNAFLAQEGVVKKVKLKNQTALIVDLDAVKKVDWGKIFWNPDYGLRGAIGQANYMKGIVDALNLAAPGIVGGANGLPLACFKFPGKWETRDSRKIVRDLTRYIIEKKLKLLDEDGHVSADKIRSISDWSQQYNSEVAGCLTRSGFKIAYEAIKATYPELCGWGVNQLQPGDIRFAGMWRGVEGAKLFKLKLAAAIYDKFKELAAKRLPDFEKHNVRFYPSQEKSPLIMDKLDAISLLKYMNQNGRDWYDFFRENNLTAAYLQVGKNLQNCFTILFGKLNPKTGCFGFTNIKPEDLLQRSNSQTLINDLLRTYTKEEILSIESKNNQKENSATNGKFGVAQVFMSGILERRPKSDVLELTKAFYECFAAAVLPSSRLDEAGVDRFMLLDKVLGAVYPKNSEGVGGYILSDRRLVHLLKAISESIYGGQDYPDSIKNSLIDIINRIRKIKRPTGTPREVLFEACKLLRNDLHRNCLLNSLNVVLEDLVRVILKFENQHYKKYGSFSENNLRIFDTIHEEGVDLEDEIPLDHEPDRPEENVENELDENPVVMEYDDDFEDRPVESFTNYQLSEKIREVRKVFMGSQEEDLAIRNRILNFLRHGKISDLYQKLEVDFPMSLIGIIHQLRSRFNQRAKNRFDYALLRGREIPTHNIDCIYENVEGSEKLNLDRIDRELFINTPNWWPFFEGRPQAVPVLFSQGQLHVALFKFRALDNIELKFQINSKLRENVVFFEISDRTLWDELRLLFINNYRFKTENAAAPTRWQFMSAKEELQLLNDLVYLRSL